MSSTQIQDEDYYIDPPSPPQLKSPVTKIVNSNCKQKSKKCRSSYITATKSRPLPQKERLSDENQDGDSVPHQWTPKQIKTLIQIRLSDDVDLKFRTTKKSHRHIWVSVATKLQSLGINVDHLQAQTKYTRLRREYTKRYTKTKKSGSDPSYLHDWEFYEDLEPSFRSCKQISPDSTESSEPTPDSTDGAPDSSEPAASSQVESESSSLVFPNRRRKRALTQEERDEVADKRFKWMQTQLMKTDEILAEYNELYRENSQAQTKFYNIKAELAAAQLAALRAQQSYPPYFPRPHRLSFPGTPDQNL